MRISKVWGLIFLSLTLQAIAGCCTIVTSESSAEGQREAGQIRYGGESSPVGPKGILGLPSPSVSAPAFALMPHWKPPRLNPGPSNWPSSPFYPQEDRNFNINEHAMVLSPVEVGLLKRNSSCGLTAWGVLPDISSLHRHAVISSCYSYPSDCI
ncbi:hypothetical protein RUM44_011624 [Polyplax serrata]|uniref:Uncharacterized protein n=1 Tax=Polyplax serrata TaxID=468196 RepID=A0ABR1AQV5_POLSC